MDKNVYIHFLQYALDSSKHIPENIGRIDWMQMMEWAEQQAIVGVIYGGIQRAGKALGMPFDALMEWVGYAQQIEVQNKLLNKRCVEFSEMLQKDGFECCILKGQGNALMYPNPLLRTSGDMDVWLKGKSISDAVEYSRKHFPAAKACYHHVDFGDYEGVEVEIHYRPSFRNNMVANFKLQRWFEEHKKEQFLNSKELPEGVGTINVPTWEFNVVFQLCHIYQHVIKEGIGLRQIVDYYYLLRISAKSEMSNEELEMILRHQGLTEIAGAVMWVLKEVLGLEEKYLIAPVDERRGRFLLSEIMEGGNFGRGLRTEAGWLNSDNAVARNINRLKRDARLLRYFPSECLWEPVFRVYHFFWRLAHR